MTTEPAAAPSTCPRTLEVVCACAGVAKLNAAVVAAMHDKQVHDLLASEGIEAQGNSVEQFRAFLQSEGPRWAKIVKESGAHVD